MRVAICQPLIPAYRVPLFERLGALPSIDLTVFAGGTIGSLAGVEAGEHFRFRTAPVRRGPMQIAAQWAQIRAALTHFDLIIAPWDIHYLTLIPMLILARIFHVSVVLWGHGYGRRPRLLTDSLRRLYGKAADGVLVYSRRVANELIQEKILPATRVFVALNAIDQSSIRAATRYWLDRPCMLQEFRHTRDLDSEQTLIFVSRLESENRIDILLRATAELCKKRPRLKTVIVGDGTTRPDLERLRGTLNLDNQVIFTGPLYRELDLAPWMLSATVFCYPTRIGLSIFHAFGYGLPLVTTDSTVAQNPELEAFIDCQNGLRYRDGNVEDLAKVCDRLLGDRNLRAQMSARALATVTRDYSIETMVHGFQHLFDSIRALRSAMGRRSSSRQ